LEGNIVGKDLLGMLSFILIIRIVSASSLFPCQAALRCQLSLVLHAWLTVIAAGAILAAAGEIHYEKSR
jgi:hypothetical protein